MRIALVHYHLRPGGVTRVIADQVEALRGRAQTMVITGEAGSGSWSCPAAQVAALAYDRDREGPIDAAAAAAEMVSAARQVWPQGASLFHFHNPTLGKNQGMVQVIRSLQQMGQTVLLQIHDFAEDGRPDLYSKEPYPEDCHYAVINRRDEQLLRRCGLSGEGLHYLPNAVRPLAADAGRGRGSLFLYPVRAIRRKNVGEALLLSLFLPAGSRLAITLEPTGPLDRRSYDAWKGFSEARGLGVGFGVGVGRSLESLLSDCRAVVTTSVREGFGFAFLEPWTAALALHGRYLRETCPDFADAGLSLDHLYRIIRVPPWWVDRDLLERKRQRCRQARLAAYGIAGGSDSRPASGDLDFGSLSEDLQRDVLTAVLESPARRKRLLDDNPALGGALAAGLPPELIEANRRAVLEEFSLEATASRLLSAFRQAAERPVRQSIDKAALVRELNAGDAPLLLCPDSYE